MKNSIKLISFLMILLVLTSCLRNNSPLQPLDEGTGAPDFILQTPLGDEVKLSDFNNQVVLLFFFGNSCPTCKAAAPLVESMLVVPYNARTDYVVLGLDQWNGNAASVELFKIATDVSFPLLLDASNVAAEYQTTYDRLILIDKEGNIVFSGTQGAAADIETVKEKIDDLLAE